MFGIKVVLTLLISTLTSNISFFQLSSLISGYPASGFFVVVVVVVAVAVLVFVIVFFFGGGCCCCC